MASNLSNLLFTLKNKPLQICVVLCSCDCMPQIQSDYKYYIWFVIEELSGILRAFWPLGIFVYFRLWPWQIGNASLWVQCTTDLRDYDHYKSKITLKVAFYFQINIKYSQYVSRMLSVGIWWTILTAGHQFLRSWLAVE